MGNSFRQPIIVTFVSVPFVDLQNSFEGWLLEFTINTDQSVGMLLVALLFSRHEPSIVRHYSDV